MSPRKWRILLFLLLSSGGVWRSLVEVKQQSYFCGSDFAVFYAGGKLAGTPGLYSPEKAQAVQQQAVGCHSDRSRFIRLPYYAFVFWPLAQLSFSSALLLWRLLMVAGTIVCIGFWPFRWELGVLICSWSVALDWNLINGQDIVVLLLCVSAGEFLISRSHPLTGGLCLSLCAAKFHLLVFLPLLLFQRRMWGVFSSLVLGGLVLLSISFWTNGLRWPQHFLQAISDPRTNPGAVTNLYGVFGNHPGWELLSCTFVAIVVWYICMRAPFAIGLSAVLIAGCLTSRHQVPSDLALLIPAAGLVVREMKRPRWMNLLLCLLLAPPITLFAGKVEVLLMIALLCGIAFCVRPGGGADVCVSTDRVYGRVPDEPSHSLAPPLTTA
jgi:hypothetical protein